MAEQVEYFRFFVTDEVTGRRRRTRFAMSVAEATDRYGADAIADPNTRELRTVYGPDESPPANTKPPD